jgi:hypothetical protein
LPVATKSADCSGGPPTGGGRQVNLTACAGTWQDAQYARKSAHTFKEELLQNRKLMETGFAIIRKIGFHKWGIKNF